MFAYILIYTCIHVHLLYRLIFFISFCEAPAVIYHTSLLSRFALICDIMKILGNTRDHTTVSQLLIPPTVLELDPPANGHAYHRLKATPLSCKHLTAAEA